MSVRAGLSHERTIGTQSAASCSSTSQTAGPSRTSTTGWRRPRAMSSPTTSSFCWSATSATWRPCARSPGRRPRSWPGPSGCATWRPQRWTRSTLRRWISTNKIINNVLILLNYFITPTFWLGLCGSDQGHLWAGPERRHKNPGRLGGRQERICPQHRPFLWGGHQGKPPVLVLIR